MKQLFSVVMMFSALNVVPMDITQSHYHQHLDTDLVRQEGTGCSVIEKIKVIIRNFIIHILLFGIGLFALLFSLVSCNNANPKTDVSVELKDTFHFSTIYEIPATPIKQQISGTCWAYSTASFLESEIYRIKGYFIELSPMYFVYNAYIRKSENFILRQGTARFSEGGCNYDPLIDVDSVGIMPSGIYHGDTVPSHQKLMDEMLPLVNAFANRKIEGNWRGKIKHLLDAYLGCPPTKFIYKGTGFTPKQFWEFTELNKEHYVNLTSFIHEPLNEYVILQIPANWTSMRYFNVSLDEYMENIDNALSKGFSLAVAMDLTGPELSEIQGFARMPSDSVVSPETRQRDFENFITTDDHNMHIIGKVRDKDGNLYYKCKNSWGVNFGLDGCYYLSPSYLRAKSIYVMVNQKGLLDTTYKKMEKCRCCMKED